MLGEIIEMRILNYFLRGLGLRKFESNSERWRKLGAKIGERVFAENVSIEEKFASLLIVEDDVVIAANTRILFHDSSLNNIYGLPVKFGYVIIRKKAYIGSNCTILCGVEIGECALIGAGSVVTKDIPPGAMAYGVPAKIHGSVGDLAQKYKQQINETDGFFYLDVLPWRLRMSKKASSEYGQTLEKFLNQITRQD